MKNLQNIFDDCGLNVQHIEPVQGGDINESFCLVTSTGKFFLKVNDKNDLPLMFEKEAKGLDLLRRHSSLEIPRVIKSAYRDDKQYLLLEWMEKGHPSKNMWEKFGQALALMHKHPQGYFGLEEDNYIGSCQQVNTRHRDWYSFYTECRIMPLIKMLFDERRCSLQDITDAESFCLELKNIFPIETSSLLHGDLWGGNYLIHSSGYAAVFDPAVYYGHREMDIGMSKLFGGFDRAFYDAYNHYYPLEKNWEKRLPLTQLYPILVHAVLFGGHYVSSAISTINKFS